MSAQAPAGPSRRSGPSIGRARVATGGTVSGPSGAPHPVRAPRRTSAVPLGGRGTMNVRGYHRPAALWTMAGRRGVRWYIPTWPRRAGVSRWRVLFSIHPPASHRRLWGGGPSALSLDVDAPRHARFLYRVGTRNCVLVADRGQVFGVRALTPALAPPRATRKPRRGGVGACYHWHSQLLPGLRSGYAHIRGVD